MHDTPGMPANRDALVGRLPGMVASGRVLEEEAEAVRSAVTPEELAVALGRIRGRHAAPKLAAAVAAGEMEQDEADEHLKRLVSGEHVGGLRSDLRDH